MKETHDLLNEAQTDTRRLQFGAATFTGETMTKTIRQYSEPLPEGTMEFLRGIAGDYAAVKNSVYRRYSGIKHLNRLTPAYDILTEMRVCGLRQQLNLPVVYYELAILDAITDIKARWGLLKNLIGGLITANTNLNSDDRMYLRTVLKINSVYAAILNHQEYEMPKNADGLALDVKRLNNLLRRLTRKHLPTLRADRSDYFRVSPSGYAYQNGSLFIVSRTPRKRKPIPLKDEQRFHRQLQISIQDNFVIITVPVEARIQQHPDYVNTVFIHIGSRDMFTLSNGAVYGKSLNVLVDPETERLAQKNRKRAKIYAVYWKSLRDGNWKKAAVIKANNLGGDKYRIQKEKERAKTITFINTEINRMIRTERPQKIVITKQVTKGKTKFYSKKSNRKLTRSFNSYIRERLAYKCRLHSIELIEINAKGTGILCSACGTEGKRQPSGFYCERCGLETTISLNSALNIENIYRNKD